MTGEYYEYEKQIGQNIKKLREEKDLTQEELSAQLMIRGCDITRSAVAKMEVGQRHIYAHEIKILAEIFKVPYEKLFI